MKKLILISLVLFFALLQFVQAQPVPTDYFEDTVWTRKTDQSAGFWMVKFSNTDSLIVGHGYDYDLFFDAKTGQEIRRILGNNEVVFINNDYNFIRSNEQATKIEIFDTETFQVIDTFENDSNIITGSIVISNDEKYLVAPIPHGFRIWDVQLKQIVKTKIYEKPNEPNLINYEFTFIRFLCDNSRLIGQYVKTYQNPDPPYNQYQIGNFIVYDYNTLDSIDNYNNSRGFIISNSCKYIASATGDPDYGVEVYDFNTKEFLWKMPINGPSLTGIEFSPDDKYLVTSSGPDVNAIYIWNIDSGKKEYEYKDGGYGIIYPNPSTGVATIQYQQKFSEITNIYMCGLNGQIIKPILNHFLEEGIKKIDFNTHDIPSGSYFIKIENTHLSLVFKLIVNK